MAFCKRNHLQEAMSTSSVNQPMAEQAGQQETGIKGTHRTNAINSVACKSGCGGSGRSPVTPPLWKPGQPPAENSDLQAQRVKQRQVEHYTRIPRSWRPFAVVDDQAGDESSYSIPPRPLQEESLSQTLRKPKHLETIWRLRFSRWPILRSGSYWDGLRGAEFLHLKPCQGSPVNHTW
jgi:hypothetical protein